MRRGGGLVDGYQEERDGYGIMNSREGALMNFITKSRDDPL